MDVRIVGVSLPGRDWATYANVHVGIQRRADVVDLFPGDVDEAVWDFDVDATAPYGDLRACRGKAKISLNPQ